MSAPTQMATPEAAAQTPAERRALRDRAIKALQIMCNVRGRSA